MRTGEPGSVQYEFIHGERTAAERLEIGQFETAPTSGPPGENATPTEPGDLTSSGRRA